MTDEYNIGLPEGFVRADYRGTLNIESVLTSKYADCLKYRDLDIKTYCSSVESFVLGLPEDITERCLVKLNELGLKRGHYGAITEDILVRYDELFRYAKQELKKVNIIFKSGSYGVGHD